MPISPRARIAHSLRSMGRALPKLSAIFGLLSVAAATSVATPPTLSFRIDEGRNINSFVREGPVAAHLLVRSGNEPRILVAFPAGNSGVGLWFENTATPTEWSLAGAPRPV